MSRDNFDELVDDTPFKVTAHISMNVIEDLIRTMMLHTIVDPVITQVNQNNVYVVTLSPPTFSIVVDNDIQVQPIPAILVPDENGQQIQLTDPVYPADKTAWDFFFRIVVPASIRIQSSAVPSPNDPILQETMTALVRPYYSTTNGIGFERYDLTFALGLNAIRDAFYPEIIKLLPQLTLPLPEVDGLTVTAAKFFTNLDSNRPGELSLGLGGQDGTPDDLLPLLDAEDGLAVSVSQAYFDAQIAAYNDDLDRENEIFPKGTLNFDEDRYEKINFLRLTLAENEVQLKTKINIENIDLFSPDAEITINGPLSFEINSTKTDTVLTADNSRLDVDIDIGFGWDFIRIIVDAVTGDRVFKPEINEAERSAARNASEQISDQLNSSLLGSFPSRKEIYGKDVGIIRHSAVILGEPNAFQIIEKGIMITGPAAAGVIHADPKYKITSVYRVNNTIKAYGINERFWMWKDTLISHIKESLIRVKGVQLITRRDGVSYLRDYADRNPDDNLLAKPFFNPGATTMLDGNHERPLGSPDIFQYDQNGVITELTES